MKVLYFSSTGNSLWVARQFTDTPQSIIQLMRSGTYEISDDEAIGIITPDHYSNVPKPMRMFLEKATLKAPYVFAIVTYGGLVMSTVRKLSSLQKFDYINTLFMIDNYFPVFNQQKQIENAPKKEIQKHLDSIIADVNARKDYIKDPGPIISILGSLWSFPTLFLNYKRFYVEHDKCTKCCICEKVCPMDNITYNPWPVIGSNCLVCGACRQNCPKNAIRYKGEKDTVQFRNANVTVADIINAND